jgi:hypothetical protein
MIERVASGELNDIIQTLSHCDIVIPCYESSRKNKVLGKQESLKRLSMPHNKLGAVSLKCDLSELMQALD